jgi:hypothetical protein
MIDDPAELTETAVAPASAKKKWMWKCECTQCGYLVRTTARWLEVGPPICPVPEHGSMRIIGK